MRSLLAVLLAATAVGVVFPVVRASAQACVGLECQQLPVTGCPNGGTTSLTGTVYAPNGIDPLPDILVYVPNAPVAGFTAGVSCPVVGTPPSGSPLVGATTNFDGTFTIPNMPVGTNIPLVIQTGRWRRQVVIPSVQACMSTTVPVDLSRFPRTQLEGDIPRIAVATGAVDAVECVLRKVGIADSEFTNASGSGRINFYGATGKAGAEIDALTPTADTLLGTQATLNQYDVLMLPCEGGQFIKPAQELANVVNFANAGGRIYSSHYSYVWMFQNPPFNTVANWTGRSVTLPDGIATVDQSFSEGKTLAEWLQLVGATTTVGQMPIATLRQDMNGVNKPTQSYLALNYNSNPVMQFVFDTPVGQTGGQCGRVLFNEYHVEAAASTTGMTFPTECSSTTALTPQEKLLEFSLFELTSDGSAATLTPPTQDFGTEAVGFNSPTQTFTWTNNSTFAAAVTLLTGSGDFNNVSSSGCSSVLPGASCQIYVVFNPTAVGARTGTLTVGSSGTTLTSTLTGTGIPDLTFSLAALSYGSVDVGAVRSQSFTVTNGASGTVPVPALLLTGDYAASSNCGGALGAGASCTVIVSFKPTTTGSRPGTLQFASVSAAYPTMATTLSGNGVDFTLGLSPNSGSTVAGYQATTTSTTTPLAGFAAPLTIGCTTTAPATTCTMSQNAFTPGAPVTDLVTITTGAKYTVIGYGGVGGGGWMWMLAVASGCLLWARRRSMGGVLRGALVVLMLAVAGMSVTGCSGKLPAQNPVFTGPGTYTFTVTATDGFLVHSATYALTVTTK